MQLNEIKLSTDINQIEFEIQHYKQVAGQSIWEIGRRLKHVKEHDLVHGEFMEWVGKQGIAQREANRMMKVATELPNWTTSSNLGTEVLYLIATLPYEEKEEQLQKIEQGDSPTVKELRELKHQLKEREKDVEALKVGYRQKEAEIKELKEQPPKEVVKEVVPEDYEQIKQEIQNLQSNNQSLSDQINQMKAEREAEEKDSRKYRELSEAIQEMEGKMDRTQKLIQTQKKVYELVDESKDLLARITPIPYLIDADFVRENEVAKRELGNVAKQTQKFLDNLNDVLKESQIIEGEIIHE